MNLFAGPAEAQEGEVVETLLERSGLRILRILSHGEKSPPGFWYDEPEGEWVAVLQGVARLRFEDEKEPRTLLPGDFVAIAPHRRHRVEWTDPQQTTIWLAVYFA